MHHKNNIGEHLATIPEEIQSLIFPTITDRVNMGKTCKKYNQIFLTEKFYMDRYIKIHGNFANNSIKNVHAENHDAIDTFLKSLIDGIEYGARTGNHYAGPGIGLIGAILGTITGLGHGLFSICTRKFLTIEELEDLHLRIQVCESMNLKSRKDLLNNILLNYEQYKSAQRFQEPSPHYKKYYFATSRSSMNIISILTSYNEFEYQWNSLINYINQKENNGKALLTIIYESLQEVCPENLSKGYHRKISNSD